MDEPTFILRRLSVSETWRQTWDVFMKRYELFLIVASLSYIMAIILFGTTMSAITDVKNPELHVQTAVVIIETCLYHLINIIGHAAMSRGVAEIYLGRVPILHECLMQGLQVFCPLVLAWLIILTLAMIGSFGLLGVAGATGEIMGFSSMFLFLVLIGNVIGTSLIMGAMSLITPTATIEKLGTCGILKRSLDLTFHDFVFILCTIVALDWGRVVVDLVIKAIFIGGVGGDDEMTYADVHYSWSGVLISKVTILIFAPLTSIMQTLIYFNIRIEKEGLNEQILGQQLEGAVFGSPAPVMNPVSSPGYVPVNLGGSELSMNGMGGGASNSSPLVNEAL